MQICVALEGTCQHVALRPTQKLKTVKLLLVGRSPIPGLPASIAVAGSQCEEGKPFAADAQKRLQVCSCLELVLRPSTKKKLAGERQNVNAISWGTSTSSWAMEVYWGRSWGRKLATSRLRRWVPRTRPPVFPSQARTKVSGHHWGSSSCCLVFSTLV